MPVSRLDLSIVIPTYCEAVNLPVLVPRIAAALADQPLSWEVIEMPILFSNRLRGKSKLSFREQVNYLRHLTRLYAFRFPVLAQLARFGMVGLSGMAVDLTAFAGLLAAGIPVPAAAAASILAAMSWNFCGNRRWTFADCRRDAWLRQYVLFCGSCLVGGLLNWMTRVLLWRYVPFFAAHELLAAVTGVAAGTASNFSLCRTMVFRSRRRLKSTDDGTLTASSESGASADDEPEGRSPRRMLNAGKANRSSELSRGVRLLVFGACLVVFGVSRAPLPGPRADPSSPHVTGRTHAPFPFELADAGTPALRNEPQTAAPVAAAEFDFSDTAIEQRLQAAAEYLASDELEGRGIRTRGLNLAAVYLAREFAAAGLRTDLCNGTPFHEFKLFSGSTKGSVQELSLHAAGGQPADLKPGVDFTSLTLSVQASLAVPVVFAGYGITAPEYGYDDYAGQDVAGKAVIVLRREPQQADPQSVFDGAELSDHALLRRKIDNAVEHGAVLLILCTDAFAMQAATDETSPPADELLRVELAESSLRASIPVVHCRRPVVEELVQSALGETLADIEARIDAHLTPGSRELPDSRITARVALSREQRTLRNVVAGLEGAGPLAAETLILGAHYDHLGRGGWGSLAIGANAEVHNGADDNASGTAVLLEIARQLAGRPDPLPRRILFIAFSAEELGLIGSSRYVRDPVVPLADTIAMLNLDMVGRLRNDKLTIYGTGTAAEWPGLIERANEPLRLNIRSSPDGYGPSDHASFFERGVPVLHFFTGFHNQYHRPTDDAELLNVGGMRQIAELVEHIAVELAQAEQRPALTAPTGEFDFATLGDLEADDAALKSAHRPQLGLILAPREAGDEGVRVQRLTPQGAAVQHGIRPGDLLLSIDGKPADSADAVIQALRDHSAEDVLRIRLQRRGVEIELEICL